MRKYILLLVSFVFTLTLVGCNNNQKYDTAIADFYTDTDSTFFFAGMALDSYSTAWSDAIDKGQNFNTVLSQKVSQSQKSFGSASDTLLKDMSKNLKIISEASQKNPSDYKEMYQECKKMYLTLSSLVEQVNSPSGSLVSFNQNVNQLTQDYKSSHDMIKTLLSDNVNKIIKQKEQEQKKKDNENKK